MHIHTRMPQALKPNINRRGGGYRRLRLFSGTLIATFCALFIVGFLISCEEASSGSGSGEAAITATVLPRDDTVLGTTTFKPDEHRTHFVTFSIKTSATEEGSYRIGAKLASQPAPTAEELIAATAAITRDLDTTAINIYLPYHIEGTHFDTGVTKSVATITNTQLSPDTEYTIYATLASGTGSVDAVLSARTDAVPAPTHTYNIPSEAYTYTIKADELLIFRGATNDAVDWIVSGTIIQSCLKSGTCLPSSPPNGYAVYNDVTNAANMLYYYMLEVDTNEISQETYSISFKNTKTVSILTANFITQP